MALSKNNSALYIGLIVAIAVASLLYISRMPKVNAQTLRMPVGAFIVLAILVVVLDVVINKSNQTQATEMFQIKETGVDTWIAKRSGDPNSIFLKDDVPMGPSMCVPLKQDTWKIDQSTTIKPGTIFVSVAAFRDIECKDTILQMFDKAQNPQNIFVGVVQQIKTQDEDCFDQCGICAQRKKDGQIRVTEYLAEHAMGPCRARFQCSKLWDGEEFFLQIDSHTQFDQNWDAILLEEFAKCQDPKAVIGGYPATHKQLKDFKKSKFSSMIMHCKGAVGEGLPGVGAAVVTTPEDKRPPVMPYCGAGQMMMRYTALFDVPYDPVLTYLFMGEEILHSARLWTSGYNFYAPTRSVMSHSYEERKESPRIWTNNDKYAKCRKMAVNRAKCILGLIPQSSVEPDYQRDIDSYGLGNQRSISQYWEFIGASNLAKMAEKAPLTGVCKPGHYEEQMRKLGLF